MDNFKNLKELKYIMNDTVDNIISMNLSNPENSTALIDTSFPIHNNTLIEITQNSTTFLSQIDPNWFYSTTAQSAAAIVGLMGAFITTKLINHKIFVKHLQIEISDYQEKIDFIKNELEPKVQYTTKLDYEKNCELVDEFLESVIPSMDPNNLPDVDTLYDTAVNETEYTDINNEVLEEKYDEDYFIKVNEYHENLVDKFLNVEKKVINPITPPTLEELLDKAKKNHNYKDIKKSVLEKKYDRKYLSDVELYRQKSPVMSGMGLISAFADYSDFNDRTLIMPNSISHEAIKKKWGLYHKYKEEIDVKKSELKYYENLLESKNKLFEASDEVADLKRNLLSLFIFSILGVFLPLFMMLLDNETMIILRLPTYMLIFAGWLLVLYILWDELKKLMQWKSE